MGKVDLTRAAASSCSALSEGSHGALPELCSRGGSTRHRFSIRGLLATDPDPARPALPSRIRLPSAYLNPLHASALQLQGEAGVHCPSVGGGERMARLNGSDGMTGPGTSSKLNRVFCARVEAGGDLKVNTRFRRTMAGQAKHTGREGAVHRAIQT